MGSATSKAARKLPRESSSWPSPRAPPASVAAERARPRPGRPSVFESRNQALEEDVKDPHFMEKLNQLGPVRVDHHMHTVRAASDIQNTDRSGIRSEAEAASLQSAKNRLLASSLTELLEARKSITSNVELETLAKRFHVDTATFQRLGRVVNTPSIDESAIVRTTDEQGGELVTAKAHWIDPVLSHRP